MRAQHSSVSLLEFKSVALRGQGAVRICTLILGSHYRRRSQEG